ncbi:MAG: hypothetical protein ACHQXA_08280 [Gemmatimonadales bacterium]
MCYLLRVASPLSLSEMRSMLPAGMTAEARDPVELRRFQHDLPDAQTLATLAHGACACDLVAPRPADPKEDDAELRRRYHALKATRTAIIHALERHAKARALRKYAAGHWPAALHRFVVEHARNAGPTLYHLTYAIDHRAPLGALSTQTTIALPGPSERRWLEADHLFRVLP